MTQEEIAIENLAQKYFSTKTVEDRNNLWVALSKAIFVKKIFYKNLGKFTGLDGFDKEEIDGIFSEVINKTIDMCIRNYKLSESFVKYFSSNYKFCMENHIKGEYEQKELSLNAPKENGDEESDETLIDDVKSGYEDNNRKNEEQKQYRKKILKIFEKFYTSTKAGQKNKGVVLLYMVLEMFSKILDSEIEEYVSKCTFLSDNKELLRMAMDEIHRNNGEVPTQKDFAVISGIPATKFADVKTSLRQMNDRNEYS